MGAWAHDDADKDIKAPIEEQILFKLCTDFKYKKEVKEVFNDLTSRGS